MKTNINFVKTFSLCILIHTGCTKQPAGPLPGPSPCNNCNTQLPYELNLETNSIFNGFHVSTATLIGEFAYPVTVKWYIKYYEYRRLNKTDTLTSAQQNKSFYQYNASDVNGNFRLECDATMANGVTLTKSTAQ